MPPEIDDSALEAKLYRVEPCAEPVRPEPGWAEVHSELKRPHVTLSLLWQEYRSAHPDGYEYSWFCEHYRAWQGRTDLVMRQEHKFGEKVFVDFAGATIPVVCSVTGTARPAHLFVAVLGASNYTYVEATWGEDVASWVGAHARMFSYFGGCPKVVVPDNLKSGVTKACFYDPEINPTYQALADHYGVVVLPARKRKPRDKAKVEQGVLLVQRWIVAVLRNRKFFDLPSLNAAIEELLDRLNERKFRKLPGSRRIVFERDERPVMGPLPAEPYYFAHRKKATVYLDYHVEVEGYYYSVPYALVKEEVEVRYSARVIEVLHKNQRVASHARSTGQRYTTLPEHMPPAHRSKAAWSAQRFQAWAARFGKSTEALVAELLCSRAHPEQSFRACLGVLQELNSRYGAERLEAACSRAVHIGSHSYRSVRSILEKGLDKQPIPGAPTTTLTAGFHENVRGPGYYN